MKRINGVTLKSHHWAIRSTNRDQPKGLYMSRNHKQIDITIRSHMSIYTNSSLKFTM